MPTKQIRWHEGMLVLPHHFQASEDNLRDGIRTTFDWLQPYSHGLISIEVTEASLADYEVRIPRLTCRFKDGTLSSTPENSTLDVLSVRELFQEHDELYVFALLPNVVPGRPNSAASKAQAEVQHRYIRLTQRVEELNSGENSRDVEFYEFNLQLVAQPNTDPPSGFESLPLLKLRRSTQPGAVPEIDPTFVPPLLNCRASNSLQEGILIPICSQLGSFIKTQSEALQTRGGWLEASSPDNLRSIMLLNGANSSYPLLLALLESRLLHPFQIYTELCRTIGQLSIARQDWEPPSLPKYDHENLYEVFRNLQVELDTIFQADGAAERVQRMPFIGTGNWLEVSCDSSWFTPGHEFFIGIRSQLSPETLDRLFADSHLDWKLGSSQNIAQIFQNAESGISIHRLTGRQSALPSITDMTYYRVEDRGPYWNAISESGALALKVNDRFIRGSYTGKNTVTVVDQHGDESELSFDLFVVKHG